MCSDTIAITVDAVSKCYQSYARPVDRLIQALNRSRRKLYTEFWALNDARFEVFKGETFGIVGQNGSGKSTLLQIIAGTLRPTTGRVDCRGRIAAILELGAGFNPDFSGIENARLNAAIIGVSEAEFQQSMPEIIEFSGLGDFIHQPVKTYSSGMYVRLAFSVSISLKPDILIIDEALAVGDARFQRKCFRKLETLKANGVTILFVSHSMESVVSHCDRAMFLEQGRIQLIGEPKQVVNCYLDLLFKTENDSGTESAMPAGSVSEVEESAGSPMAGPATMAQAIPLSLNPTSDNCPTRTGYNPQEYRWGDGRAKIIDYFLAGADSEHLLHQCKKGDACVLYSAVAFDQAFSGLIFGLTIKTTDGKTVYGTNSRLQELALSTGKPGDVLVVKFAFTANLAGGDYFISLGVSVDDEDKDHIPLDRRYDLIHFSVADDQRSFGIADLDASIECVRG